VKLRRRQTGIDTPLTDRMVVGRLKECPLAIDEANVSRRHAQVEARGDQWWIVDLNSSNGISLNGHAAQEFQIQAGDLVTFGGVAFDVLSIPKQKSNFEVEQIELEPPTSLVAAASAAPKPVADTIADPVAEPVAESSRADLERARLHRELRGAKHSGGLGDLGQQSLWTQILMAGVGLLVVFGVVLGVRWLMALISPTA
jgi:predicted component of type VI protein secretion system